MMLVNKNNFLEISVMVRMLDYKSLKEFRKLTKPKFRQYRQGFLDKLDSMYEKQNISILKTLR